jgi:predicted nucleic acid-binding protein
MRRLEAALYLNESEATGRAPGLSANWLMVDKFAARRGAVQLGLRVGGTVGVLLRCKSNDIVRAA